MADDSDFDAMTEACLEAGERVMQVGSPALQAVMRIALYVLARELAQRTGAPPPDNGAINGADGPD